MVYAKIKLLSSMVQFSIKNQLSQKIYYYIDKNFDSFLVFLLSVAFIIILLLLFFLVLLPSIFTDKLIINKNPKILEVILQEEPYLIIEKSIFYVEKQICSQEDNKIKSLLKDKNISIFELKDFLQKNKDIAKLIIKEIPKDIIEYAYQFISPEIIAKYSGRKNGK